MLKPHGFQKLMSKETTELFSSSGALVREAEGRGNELILVAGKHAATQQVIMPNSAAGAIPGWRNEERDWE